MVHDVGTLYHVTGKLIFTARQKSTCTNWVHFCYKFLTTLYEQNNGTTWVDLGSCAVSLL